VLTEPSSLARDLANTPWSEQPITVRVIELFEPRAGASTVDLSLAERDVPEIAAVLHDATELHLHGIHPRVALRCLPDVKHAVLAGISVVVHGRVPAPREHAGESTTPWPGPVSADRDAAATVESTGPGAPSHLFLDVHAPDLLPRACGPLPLVLDDCGRLAVICLAETLSDGVRGHLRLELAQHLLTAALLNARCRRVQGLGDLDPVARRTTAIACGRPPPRTRGRPSSMVSACVCSP